MASTLSYTVPTVGLSDATQDPLIATALTTILTWASNISTEVADSMGSAGPSKYVEKKYSKGEAEAGISFSVTKYALVIAKNALTNLELPGTGVKFTTPIGFSFLLPPNEKIKTETAPEFFVLVL